jgi:TP901 family phage tail tape measure protein
MAKTTELELAIKIAGKVDPSLQAAISQAQKQVSTLSATLGHIGRVGLAVMGVGLAATVKGIADCTKEAEKFESQMAPVIRYVDGLADSLGNVSDAMADNGKTFKQNRDELARYIQDLSTEIPRDTEQLTQISSALGQSGIGVDEQINTSILRDTAKAATAMDLDDQTAGNYMAKWQVAFTKKDADGNTTQFNHDDVMELMDQINYLAAHNATTAPEVAQSVNQAASFGQIAGIDPAATAAIATAMQATGVATDRVGTSITRIYTNLSKGENATKKQKEMLEELGFTAEGVAKSLTTPGQGVSTLRSIFGAINEMPDERKVAALSTLFGQWAIEGGAKIVNNLPLLDKTLAEVQDKEAYTGSMEREFIINASTSESVSMMTSNAKTALMQDIGEQFLPVKKQFSLLAIDVMNGIRHNLPELQTLASTLADIATKGVTALGDAMQSAMPYIQQGLDYLNKNGEKVAKILAGVAGAFAAMSIAPQAEIAAKGVGSVVKGGAGMFSTAVSTVSKAGGTAVKTGGNLLGGLGTLRDIVGAANQDAAMNGSSTTGVLARLALGSAKETKAGKAAVSVGNWAGNLFGNAKDFALSQWDLSKGMADGAIAGANGVKSFINNIISPAEPATTTALVAAAPTALTTPGTAMTAAQAPLSDMGLLGAVMSRLRGGATAAKQAAGNPLKDAGIQILQGAGGMASSAFSGAKTLETGAMPFVSAFGGIASAALPVVAVIGSIVAAVSLLGEHLDDIRNIIGNVFGEQGVAVFDGFLNTITGIKDKIVGVFSPENLASVRTAIVGMFGENAGTGFDNIVSIGQSVIGVFQQIVNFGTQTVKPMFEQVFGWVSTTLLPGLLNAFNALAPQIGPIITNIGTAVMNVANMIGNAIQAVLPVIESIIMVILSVVSTVGPPILAAIAQIAQNIGNVITSIQGVFEGLIQFITGVFTGNWSSAWEGVKSIFSNAFSALVELCKIPINAVIGIINGAINGINSILGSVTTIPEWVPVVGGKGFSMQLPTIPMLAKGGFTDGVSIAGEAGTEAVISFDPSVRSTNIANWQKAGQMLGVDPVQAASVAGAGSLTTDRMEVADIGGGTPAPGGTTTVGGGSFTFSPKITIQGNADYNVMMNAMTDAKDQFEQWFNEMMRKQQRTAYAR